MPARPIGNPSSRYRQVPMSRPTAVGAPAGRAPTARDDVLRALADLGGSATPAELRQATGRPARTVTDALARLRADGFAGGPKNRPEITAAGRAAAGAVARGPVGRFEEAVDAVFGPSPPLAAFCRLAADLVVARHLYPERDFHPALFAYGAIGRGKTAAAELLARALGLGRDAILSAPALAAGELVGRRSAVAGGGFRFEPARHLVLPFFCLDELGEADADVRKAAQVLCHGEAVVAVEGEEVRIVGTPMATWNPRAGVTVVAAPYLRRALVLCVDDVAIPDLRDRLRAAERDALGAGTLALGTLSRPAERLDEPAAYVLSGTYTQLSEEGARRTDMRLLELAALGRAARYGLGGDADRRGIAYFVAFDVLTVAETIPGLLREDWRLDVEAVLAGLGDVPGLAELALAAASHLRARAELREQISARRRADARESLELVGRRELLVASLDEASGLIKIVPVPERASARALRAMLAKLRRDAGDARGASTLDEIAIAASPLIGQAHALRSRLIDDANRRQAERMREQSDARAEREEARRRMDAYKKAAADARRQRTDELKSLKRRRSELMKLSARRRTLPDESPADVLIGAGVLRWAEEREAIEVPPPLIESLSALVKRAPKPAARSAVRVTPVLEDAAGARWRPGELGSWASAGVRAAIAAALEPIEERISRLERSPR